MTTRSLFQQAFAETGHDTDATPAGWRFGTQLSSSDPVAWVTGVWWAPSSVTTGTYEYRLYSGHIGDPGGVNEITGANGALGAYVAAGGWQLFPITPVDVSGINFQVTIRDTSATDPSYAYATGKWPASNGPLTGAGSAGGSFSGGGGTPGNGSALVFMLDANVSDTAPGGGGIDISGAAALGSVSGSGTAFRRRALSGAAALGGMLASSTAVRRKRPAGVAALGRAIGIGHADGADATIVPGTLTVRDAAGGGLVTRELGAGLTVRER